MYPGGGIRGEKDTVRAVAVRYLGLVKYCTLKSRAVLWGKIPERHLYTVYVTCPIRGDRGVKVIEIM